MSRGLCCDRFYIHMDIEDLRILAELEKCGGADPDGEQASFILDMIEENGPPDEKNGRIPYRCRHFDTVRRICRVYSSRPKMCERCGSSPESACSFPCSGPGAPGSVCYQVKKAQIDQVVRTVRGPARLPR